MFWFLDLKCALSLEKVEIPWQKEINLCAMHTNIYLYDVWLYTCVQV